MGFKKTNRQNQSRISYSKGFKVYLVTLTVVVTLVTGLFLGCSAAKKEQDFVYFDSLEGEVHLLTQTGENSQIHFSPLTNKVVFIRDNPDEHKTPQIYEKDLITKREKRISFNLGHNYTPRYHPTKPWIIYSSTSDEIIEKVDVTPAMKELGLKSSEDKKEDPPTEIYIAADDSSGVKRLTREKGFDGLATFSPDGEKVYYVRREKGQSKIMEFNLKSGSKRTLLSAGSNILSLSVSESLIAWTFMKDNGNEKLIVKKLKGNEVVFEGPDKNTFSDVELHPKEQRLLVISNLDNLKNHDVYQIDIAEKCATRFSFHAAAESHPSFGPEGKSLFFVSNRSKTNQIFATMIRPQLPCKPIEGTHTIKE
jgi:Tol biopolymer transport system component